MIDRKLRSPALTVILICVIGFASVIGTVPSTVFESGGGAGFVSTLLLAVGADHLYGTGWYTSLLVCLALLMTYCSLRGLPSIVRAFRYVPDASTLSNRNDIAAQSFMVSGASDGAIRETLIRIMKDRGYHVRSVSNDDEDAAILFDKGRAGVLGPPLVHFGLVVVFVGGLITHNFGSTGEISLGEGESYSIPGTGTTMIRLEKFSILHHPGTREPEEYVSTLLAAKKDGQPVWHALRVNQPLTLSGTSLYQMRYRPEVRYVRLAAFEPKVRTPVGITKLVIGEKAALPGQNLAVKLEEIIPDFAIDAKNNVFSRSQYFLNPAARISVYSPPQSEAPVWTGWAFKDMFPTHNSSPPLLFAIDRLSLKYYSGIKLVRDPGGPVVYLGFAFLVGGSFLTCYLFRRFIRVEFDRDPVTKRRRIRISGYSSKNRPDFLYEAQELSAQLRKLEEA
ncbi:MAG: cytochrome c biogenesis protein ResB [Candidatus Lindowbacteria bacterium]|nr:cytochrome c biogenesis protein ResB [Candidatus Lindowbacteria bacterium]